MIGLPSFFKPKGVHRAQVPPGLKVYAVGDVHGCLTALRTLIDALRKDRAKHEGPARFVFLGDLVDRGPDSAGVLELLRTYPLGKSETVHLMGNHEEFMLSCYDGDASRYASWLKNGGLDTIASYGISTERAFERKFDLESSLRSAVPDAHIAFLRTFRDQWRSGDYLFVHAGIRPGVALEEQRASDMRWIRSEFLKSNADHGVVVVHGHSIVEKIERRANRIGIDTGCYRTGILSAAILEADSLQVLSTTPVNS